MNINRLIEVAESVVYDDQVGFAAKITKTVEFITDEDGNIHELTVELTMIKKNNET